MTKKTEISEMYSRKSGLVIAFHGCDESVRDAVLNGKLKLKASDLYDSYDEIQDNKTENYFIKCYFLLK